MRCALASIRAGIAAHARISLLCPLPAGDQIIRELAAVLDKVDERLLGRWVQSGDAEGDVNVNVHSGLFGVALSSGSVDSKSVDI